jgi:sigma-B regulation protein RsbU (phosphoserine phosphatase)
VSGKGAPAALFMARTRSVVRMGVELWWQFGVEMTTGRIAEAVNRELCQNNDDRMFVTLFLGLLDTHTGRLSYTNAGHPWPFVLHPSGTVARIQAKPDLPLGVRNRAVFETHAVHLDPGDTVVVVSDGIIEAMNADGILYGLERLVATLGSATGTRAADLVNIVAATVRAFAGEAPQSDDVTALALRWLPTGSLQASAQLRQCGIA